MIGLWFPPASKRRMRFSRKKIFSPCSSTARTFHLTPIGTFLFPTPLKQSDRWLENYCPGIRAETVDVKRRTRTSALWCCLSSAFGVKTRWIVFFLASKTTNSHFLARTFDQTPTWMSKNGQILNATALSLSLSCQMPTGSKDFPPLSIYLERQVKITTLGSLRRNDCYVYSLWQTVGLCGSLIIFPRCVSVEYSCSFCPPNLILLSALRSCRFALLNHSIDVYLSVSSLVCIEYVRKLQLSGSPTHTGWFIWFHVAPPPPLPPPTAGTALKWLPFHWLESWVQTVVVTSSLLVGLSTLSLLWGYFYI